MTIAVSPPAPADCLPDEHDLVSFEPATGLPMWSAPVSDIEELAARGREAWPAWAALSLANRIELMRRFANELRRDAESLAKLIARETGKPLWESHGEVEAVIARVEIAVRSHADRAAQRKYNNGLAGNVAVRHKPHGVLAVLSGFSQPALTPASQFLPALIAGNCVVFKPSEKSPAVGEALVACMHRAGVPEGVVQLAIGGPSEGLALALHEAVSGVLFAGSVQVGTLLARKFASRPDRLLALELGGNNPLVVWNTPLIEDAAVLIAQSAFGSAGQRATSARRLIVRDTLYEPVLEAVKALADRIICGAPFDEPAPFMGPVIDAEAADGLTQSFIWLMSNGGKAIKHMLRPQEGLPFVSPAIIDVTGMAERPDTELFGPLLQVIRVSSFDEAIAEANATSYGLAAGLIGGSPQEYNRFWAHIRAGVVTWNRPTTADLPGTPLGGIGLSGNFHPGGYYRPDTCAYPVASAELEQPRAMIGVGLSS